MNLKEQVTSLELSKKLKELGVKQSSLFAYTTGKDPILLCEMRKGMWLDEDGWPNTTLGEEDLISAFSVAELGEMLMILPERNKDGELQHIEYYNTQCNDTVDCDCGGTQNFHVKYLLPSKKNDLERLAHIVIEYPKEGKSLPTEADARAKMLVYLLENKLIAPHTEE